MEVGRQRSIESKVALWYQWAGPGRRAIYPPFLLTTFIQLGFAGSCKEKEVYFRRFWPLLTFLILGGCMQITSHMAFHHV